MCNMNTPELAIRHAAIELNLLIMLSAVKLAVWKIKSDFDFSQITIRKGKIEIKWKLSSSTLWK